MTAKRQITRSEERGHVELDWLDSRHSFSFGHYYNPERMAFGPLRVVNDDIIAPKGGFPPHPHADMEIVSVVLDGALEHKDSLGNGRVIRAGEIQYMSAGTGVTHSEFNPSSDKPVHLMQIWIQPNEKGHTPAYADQQLVGVEDNQWSLLISPDGRDGSMAIRQDAELRTVRLQADSSIEYQTERSDRGFWLFVIEGEIQYESIQLNKGDSIGVEGVAQISIQNAGIASAKLMLFDLPMA